VRMHATKKENEGSGACLFHPFTPSPLHPLTPSFLREGLAGRDDAEVWEAAQESERFLITQDLDFSDIRRFTPGTHHGLLLVRLRDPGRDALAQKVRTVFQTEAVENWNGCFVVATERKIRVRRPEAP